MTGQAFVNQEYPQSKGRIDDDCSLTWNEVMRLVEDYSEKKEEGLNHINVEAYLPKPDCTICNESIDSGIEEFYDFGDEVVHAYCWDGRKCYVCEGLMTDENGKDEDGDYIHQKCQADLEAYNRANQEGKDLLGY